MSTDWARWDGPDLLLAVRVQPRASRNAFADIQGDRLRIALTAPPVDGEANRRLTAFLAESFGVARSKVHLLAGESSRETRRRIDAPRRLPELAAPLPAPPT
mgnify:FL=1